MLGEPQRTEYDWNFQLFDIPCRVHPFFWLLTALLGMNVGSSQAFLIWILVVFVSILIHEMGHAFAIRYFGWSPRIVLYSFGGLAIYDPSFAPWQSGQRPRKTTWTQIIISLAGPGAQFLLAGLVVLALYLGKFETNFFLFGNVLTLGSGTQLDGPARILTQLLLYVNIYWAVLNLMPIYPLDGGQVARALFTEYSRDGIRQSLQLSMATAIVIAVFSLQSDFYLAFMFGYLAYMSYQQLSGPYGGGFGGGGFGGGGFGRRKPW